MHETTPGVGSSPDCNTDCMFYTRAASVEKTHARGLYSVPRDLIRNFGDHCQSDKFGDPMQCAVVAGATVITAINK